MRIDGFLGPTYPNKSTSFQSDRTVNFYPELNPSPTGKSVIALMGTPGLSPPFVVGVGPVRGAHVANGKIYIVSGADLYSVSSDMSVSASLGTLTTAIGHVFMKDNGLQVAGIGGDQLAIVDGEHLYIYNMVTDAFTQVSTTFTPAGLMYLDGYFICIGKNSMSHYSSELYDGLTWGALATSPVSATPDNLVACCSPHQEAWFIKQYCTEVWYNAGTSTAVGSPLSRVQGAVMDYGTSAPHSVVAGAGTLIMLANARHGDSGQMIGVTMFNGYTPVVISPPAINYQINSMSDISDAFGYMYSQEGHTFYVITFPTGNATFVYDITTQMWHERSTYVNNIYEINRHISNCCVLYNNKAYVGDYRNGFVYEMSTAYFTDNGAPIPSMRITPHLFDKEDLGNVFIHKLQVDLEFGLSGSVGVLVAKYGTIAYPYGVSSRKYGSSSSTKPQASLSFSDDGGRTYGTPVYASMGEEGGYKKELMWRRLGYTRNGVVKLLMHVPVKKILVGGYADISL